MDDAKKRALIKSQAAKRKESGDVAPKGTVLSIKRKQQPSKGDHPHKQQKVPLEPVVGLMAEGTKTVTPAKHGSGKGLMKVPSTNQEKRGQPSTTIKTPIPSQIKVYIIHPSLAL